MRARLGCGRAPVRHLDERDRAEDFGRNGHERERVGAEQPPGRARAHERRVQRDDPREAALDVEDDRHEEETQVEQPRGRVIGQAHLQPRDRDGAQDRADEVMHAADVRHEEDDAGAFGADRLGGDDLVIDRVQPAREAGEHGRHGENDEAHALRVVADEFGALGVVAHGVAHAANGRAHERVHRGRGGEQPERDHVVHLQLRAEIEAEPVRRARAARGDAFLAAEEARQHQCRGVHHLADAERDEREDGAGAARRDGAEHDSEGKARGRARERHERHGNRQPAVDGAQEVDRRVSAEAEVHRVAEGQQARLPEEQVVREREHRGDSHLREERAGEARVEPGHERQHREHQRRREPPREAGVLHVSRVPRSPRGRTTSITTSST